MDEEKRNRKVEIPKGANWRVKPVRVVETGDVYESAAACARAIGGAQSGVWACLNGKAQTHRGYHFEYVRPDWWPFDDEET